MYLVSWGLITCSRSEDHGVAGYTLKATSIATMTPNFTRVGKEVFLSRYGKEKKYQQ